MTGLIVGIIVLFMVAAFLAAVEMAFISVHPVRLREQADKGSKGAKSVLSLRSDNQHFLGVILFAPNMTQVALAALMSYFLKFSFSIHS